MRFWSPVSIRSSALAEPRSIVLDILDVDLLHPLDRRGQREADARPERAAVAAEAGDDAALARRDRMDGGEHQPDQDERRRPPRGSASGPAGPGSRRHRRRRRSARGCGAGARRARRRWPPPRLGRRPRRGGSPHGPLPLPSSSGGGSPPPSLPLGPHGPFVSVNRPRTRPPHPEIMFIGGEYRGMRARKTVASARRASYVRWHGRIPSIR